MSLYSLKCIYEIKQCYISYWNTNFMRKMDRKTKRTSHIFHFNCTIINVAFGFFQGNNAFIHIQASNLCIYHGGGFACFYAHVLDKWFAPPLDGRLFFSGEIRHLKTLWINIDGEHIHEQMCNYMRYYSEELERWLPLDVCRLSHVTWSHDHKECRDMIFIFSLHQFCCKISNCHLHGNIRSWYQPI